MEGQVIEVEVHTHVVSCKGDNTGLHCTYVYLDGTQCQDYWLFYPHIQPYQGSRAMTRKSIDIWLGKGG